MSELTRMISRLRTQCAMLDAAIARIAGRPGIILEIGLGKARTFDHLKRSMPERTVVAFDFEIHAPAHLIETTDRVELGDFRQSLPRAEVDLGGSAIIGHADTGSRDAERDRAQSSWLGHLIEPLMMPGGIILSDRQLLLAQAKPITLDAVRDCPYFAWAMPADTQAPCPAPRRMG